MYEGQEEIRKREFPQLMERIWLNSAAYTPHATSVVEAMNHLINIFHIPSSGEDVIEMFENLNKEVYEGAAKLLDCSDICSYTALRISDISICSPFATNNDSNPDTNAFRDKLT